MSKLLAGTIAACLFTAPALAHEYNIGPLYIGHPWSRATPKGASVGGGYLTITNNGTTPDRLIGGSTPVAKEFEIHNMSNQNGVMKMRPLADGLEIKPGETVTLGPSGYHIMFGGLGKALKEGERIPASLEFARAGKVQVEFAVESMGATHGQAGATMPGMAGHDMSGMNGQHGH